ncbi:LuxR C-terminal-related transcriptional regulator [Methylobacterium sp. NEAU 140]|uniref:helix-turn-helix transcriptional regulator n=1 Tax=Methylobacterium sp. NEAU 140 TaxID=3064945 RepID=UPI002736C35F|nr:LuxR C-terminal-related transcriptional regulator [Methylobacterium sp. NEAU 140]MDP4027112.1 LuxR C-terminal-related transcriptional regulator [Methylobacterium sp. NEAU 140]
MDAAALSHLIEQIYDCAIDPALWSSTLEQIAAALDSPAGTLSISDFVTGTERAIVWAGISEHYQALYREQYHLCDLFGHELILRPVDEPATSEQLVAEDELLHSRIYREWAAPQGFRYVLLTALIKSQARLAYIGLTRGPEGGPYDAEEQARMALLAPHVRRAITIADLIDHKTVERGLFADVLDALSTAVLILDGTGGLVHANAAGERLLAAGDVLRARRGTVEPWSDRCGDGAAWSLSRIGQQTGARTLALPRRDGGTAILSVLPLATGRRKAVVAGHMRVAVFVQDQAAAPSRVEALGRTFGLTGAELRVLLGLSEGGSPADVAARYGIAPSTVRTHLKSLFTKTGMRRQKDLMRLLAELP